MTLVLYISVILIFFGYISAILVYINCVYVQHVLRLQNILSVIKVFPVIVIVVSGMILLCNGMSISIYSLCFVVNLPWTWGTTLYHGLIRSCLNWLHIQVQVQVYLKHTGEVTFLRDNYLQVTKNNVHILWENCKSIQLARKTTLHLFHFIFYLYFVYQSTKHMCVMHHS